jgi:hypothetical protein
MSVDTNSAHDEQWPFLSPEHAKFLQDPGISPDIARERGYRIEGTKSWLLSLGFGKHQARVLRWLTAHEVKLADQLLGPDTTAETLSAPHAK